MRNSNVLVLNSQFIEISEHKMRPSFFINFSLFTKMLLLTSVCTTVMASAVHLCGGVLSWWILPTAGLLVWGICSKFTSSWNVRFKLLLLLLLFYGTLWLLSGCWAGQSLDEVEYRFPAIRLMMVGWNPIYMQTVESIETFTGVSIESCRYWHLLFMSRGIELFTATCGMFMHAPLAFSLWLPAFLFFPLGITFARLPNFSRCTKCVMFLCLCALYESWTEGVVDCVIFLATTGLLLTMCQVLHGMRCLWVELIGYSFWMMVGKQSSLLTCFVIWILFSVVYLYLHRQNLKKSFIHIVTMGTSLVGLFLFVGASPYLTSWVTHGHPLYPTYVQSNDESPIDLTADFCIRNDDAQRMGHLGLFVNAYISESIANRWYAWVYDKKDFSPYCQTWQQGNNYGINAHSPTNTSERALLLISTFIVMLLGMRSERWFVCAFWCILYCFPTLYLGYLRYVPWWLILPVLSFGVLLRRFERICPQVVAYLNCGLIFLCIGGMLFRFVPAIDAAWELAPYLDNARISAISADSPQHYMNLHLLKYQLIPLKDTKIVKETDGARNFLLQQINFHVNDDPMPRVSLLANANKHPSRITRYYSYGSVLLKTYGRSLPELLWRRIANKIHKI